MIIIDDTNAAEFARSVHEESSHLCGTIPRKSEIGSLDYARPYADVMELIPESEYASRYDAMVGHFARQKKDSYNPKLQNQDGHPVCWKYSLAQHLESVRANMGLPYYQLAPESISGTFGFADRGGACDDAIAWVKEHGVASRQIVPQYNFNPSSWPAEWKNDALNCVALEVFDLGTKDMWAETMTALLTGESVYYGINWLRHAMNAEELQKVGNEYCVWTPNTWGAGQDMLLKGSKKIFDEAFVVREVTYAK